LVGGIKVTEYQGEILGFRYLIDLNDKIELEEFLIAKLEKYQFRLMEKRILQKLLGMDILKERVDQLEAIVRGLSKA
jgi:hypothetical protein